MLRFDPAYRHARHYVGWTAGDVETGVGHPPAERPLTTDPGARVDELTATARQRLPRATRADLVNAALRRGLPGDAQAASRLVAGHAQRLERAAAA